VHEYKLLRPIGARAVATYIALDPRGREADAFVITELLEKTNAVSAEEIQRFASDARRMMRLCIPT